MNIYRGIGRGRTHQAEIPQLSGGLVTTQAAHNIDDNQLTDAHNVWYHDGALRTRPGWRGTTADLRLSTTTAGISYRWAGVSELVAIPGQTYSARVLVRFYIRAAQSVMIAQYVDDNGTVQSLPAIDFDYDGVDSAADQAYLTAYDEALYAFVHRTGIYKLTAGATAWVKLTDTDFYAPLVMVNVRPLPKAMTEHNTGAVSKADLWEGYSLLTNRLRLWMTTDGTGNGWKPPLPAGLKAGSALTAVYTDSDGEEYTHSLTVDTGTYTYESAVQGDGLKLFVRRSPFILMFQKEGETSPATLADAGMVNNLRVDIELDGTPKTAKVYDMTCGTWFGGQASGLAGGTRLFLGGNAQDKALVLWSDLNNLLYFSENNYAYVGDKGQQVTAFGKQSDMLVIFKERELLYTRYVEGTELTAQSVENGAVVDVTTTAAVFPMVQLHAEIGCRCPGTIQLCGNRLVWADGPSADGTANSGGRGYTLTAANAYSERNVFPVSGAIDDRLRNVDLTAACSADWEGHYLLGIGNKVLLLDYDTYGFAYVSSYTYRDHAQKRMSWHEWRLPNEVYVLSPENGALHAVLGDTVVDDALATVKYYDGVFTAMHGQGDVVMDDGVLTARPVDCLVETKHYDMGNASRRKTWGPCYISFASDGEYPVMAELQYIGDGGESGVRRLLSRDRKRVRVLPPSGPTARLGLRLTWQGPAALDGLTLQYTTIGSVR